jgi:hypothetical protein
MKSEIRQRRQTKSLSLIAGLLSLVVGLGTALALSFGVMVAPTVAQTKPVVTGVPQGSSLQALVEPLWTDLSLAQRGVLEPFGKQWNTWSTQEKRVWVALADKFPQYTGPQQARARQRIKDWAALTPEQRRLARSNYRMAHQLPKAELADHKTRYEGMTHEQRVVLRENGTTSNTAAKYGGARTGLAKDAAKPLAPPQQGVAATVPPPSGKTAAAPSVLKP